MESKLVFERSVKGRRCATLPDKKGVSTAKFDESLLRKTELELPELSEAELTRHYMLLSRRAYGVDNGFYPLGSCTMKYNPKINEAVAALDGFTRLHPLQEPETCTGAQRVLDDLKRSLLEITGMDDITLMPAAGAHGEYTGLHLIRAYHEHNNDSKRNKIIVPDSAHGTNPASAAMNGMTIVNIASAPDGTVDLDALRTACGEDTAGFMLTNPNTLGIFDPNIEEIAGIVHGCGGLLYYDGANLNAIMGISRPGDMGFDVMHLNLHKTFATPHGGGGPGAGPVACKEKLSRFLPGMPDGIGRVRSFDGNFLVCVKALAYILSLGAEGLKDASEKAVLNANYMYKLLSEFLEPASGDVCMHEFVVSAEKLKKETGVSALDVSKALLDSGIHPPTMYFPAIVHEALMFEPTETESPETIENAVSVLKDIYETAHTDPEKLHHAPYTTPIRRVDEVTAARKPILKYTKTIQNRK